jgi:4'-phosphopantetheinyl transferase
MSPAAPPESGKASAFSWSAPPATLSLDLGEIHVWRSDLDAQEDDDVARLAGTLAPDERARAASFVFAPDRRRFTVARAALRDVLARYLDVAPEAVTLGRTGEGRPTLTGAYAGALGFSVSRSAGLALCAVAPGPEIGIDVERIMRGVAEDVVDDRVLSPAEAVVLRALPPGTRERAFFAVWTRKEAYAKARGLGLALPFDRFTVSTDLAAPALLAVADDDPERWTLRDLDVGAEYAAALAMERALDRVVGWEWPGLSPR